MRFSSDNGACSFSCRSRRSCSVSRCISCRCRASASACSHTNFSAFASASACSPDRSGDCGRSGDCVLLLVSGDAATGKLGCTISSSSSSSLFRSRAYTAAEAEAETAAGGCAGGSAGGAAGGTAGDAAEGPAEAAATGGDGVGSGVGCGCADGCLGVMALALPEEGGAEPSLATRFPALISSSERTRTSLSPEDAPAALDWPAADDELPPADPSLSCARLGGAVPCPNQSSAMSCTASLICEILPRSEITLDFDPSGRLILILTLACFCQSCFSVLPSLPSTHSGAPLLVPFAPLSSSSAACRSCSAVPRTEKRVPCSWRQPDFCSISPRLYIEISVSPSADSSIATSPSVGADCFAGLIATGRLPSRLLGGMGSVGPARYSVTLLPPLLLSARVRLAPSLAAGSALDRLLPRLGGANPTELKFPCESSYNLNSERERSQFTKPAACKCAFACPLHAEVCQALIECNVAAIGSAARSWLAQHRAAAAAAAADAARSSSRDQRRELAAAAAADSGFAAAEPLSPLHHGALSELPVLSRAAARLGVAAGARPRLQWNQRPA
eukprot:scaffold7042_cov60-Phaeocystis_antarctica.AAC.5